ncbi:hypothetical protein QEG98_42035 (plasmid) [Myxococcus sp. MxC21-1]|uniref:hypothetical protein n=1 Tax=Myxococcus sp. MxC21-1 TaxID=3041439 RepID=UPI0029312AA3|nr:hypothetical protein [Myxococcus sp. MxC21-1]WNZ66201.1 hypothetical protein QEG98_42035 [Myxococcus sp. MxC21-1]
MSLPTALAAQLKTLYLQAREYVSADVADVHAAAEWAAAGRPEHTALHRKALDAQDEKLTARRELAALAVSTFQDDALCKLLGLEPLQPLPKRRKGKRTGKGKKGGRHAQR